MESPLSRNKCPCMDGSGLSLSSVHLFYHLANFTLSYLITIALGYVISQITILSSFFKIIMAISGPLSIPMQLYVNSLSKKSAGFGTEEEDEVFMLLRLYIHEHLFFNVFQFFLIKALHSS